jgi:ABC-2 type transport system permease protein
MSTASKLVAIARVSARARLSERGELLARVAFYAVILLVFSRLWHAILGHAPASGERPAHFVWYLAITEWILLSLPPIYLDVEQDLTSGELAYRLARPISYPLARLAEGAGDMLVRMATLLPFGFGLALLFTHELPPSPVALLALPLGVAAAALVLAMQLMIGLSAFWIHDCRPLYWLWQKSAFLLGGMLLPLQLYPEGLRDAAMWSPFAAVLNGPAGLVLHSGRRALGVAASIVAWGAVIALATAWMFRRGLRRVEIGGG